MTPVVSTTTQRMYDELPEMYRGADVLQAGDMPLLRFLSLLGDQAGDIETLLDRIDYKTADEGLDGGTSDLVDPDTADDEWLTWLAQLVGIVPPRLAFLAHSWSQLPIDFATWNALKAAYTTWAGVTQHGSTLGAPLGPTELRNAIRTASLGWGATSRAAYINFLQPFLLYHQRVLFTPIYHGDPWQFLIETYVIETPNPTAVAAALSVAPRAAGLQLIYLPRIGSSWDQLAADFATWNLVQSTFATWADVTSYVPM